eukprot:2832663-Pyramimonas_sp.AAC.1
MSVPTGCWERYGIPASLGCCRGAILGPSGSAGTQSAATWRRSLLGGNKGATALKRALEVKCRTLLSL